MPVPTSCPSYCAKQAESEGDQCRAKSRDVTSGATISPRARQSHGVLRMSKFVSVPKSRWPAIHRKWQIRVNCILAFLAPRHQRGVPPSSARKRRRSAGTSLKFTCCWPSDLLQRKLYQVLYSLEICLGLTFCSHCILLCIPNSILVLRVLVASLLSCMGSLVVPERHLGPAPWLV